MTMPARDTQASRAAPFEANGRKYLRRPVPVRFPEEATVPETDAHQTRRELLAHSVRLALGDQALISSDQFLYWDPADPKKCLAPDLALRRGPAGTVPTWKVWERGAPELAVEVVSDSDRPPPRWKRGLRRYQATGVMELVRFDPRSAEPLRVWDRIDGDLVQRQLDEPDRAECTVLGLWWVVVPHPIHGRTLRLAHDHEGKRVLPTPEEREAEMRRVAERERDQEAQARRAAEARIAELEAELVRRQQ